FPMNFVSGHSHCASAIRWTVFPTASRIKVPGCCVWEGYLTSASSVTCCWISTLTRYTFLQQSDGLIEVIFLEALGSVWTGNHHPAGRHQEDGGAQVYELGSSVWAAARSRLDSGSRARGWPRWKSLAGMSGDMAGPLKAQ